MFRSASARIAMGTIAVIAGLGLLRYRPWQRAGAATAGSPLGATRTADGRQELTVGFLPVT